MRAARALAGIGQRELAARAKVAIGTIRRMESFDSEIQAYAGTIRKVQAALERAGLEFLNDEQPGVRLRKAARPGRLHDKKEDAKQ